MKEVKKEEISYKYVYVAEDGTEFRDRNECEKYENSAKGVLLAKYKDLVLKTAVEFDIVGAGCEEYDVDVVKVSNEQDADLIMQLALLFNPYLRDEGQEEYLNKTKNLIYSAINDGDYLVIGRGYNGDNDNFAVEHSKSSLHKEIDKFFTFG